MSRETIIHVIRVSGLAADRAAYKLTDIPLDQEIEYYETDTKDTYKGSVDGWVQTRSGGAQLTQTQPGSTWAYGNWPNSQSIPIQSGASSIADAAIVYQNDNVAAFDEHEITVHAGVGATSVSVFVAHTIVAGALQYEAAPVQLDDRSLVKGAAVQSVADIKAVGNYVLRGKFMGIKIVQNGGTITAAYAVRGRHGVM